MDVTALSSTLEHYSVNFLRHLHPRRAEDDAVIGGAAGRHVLGIAGPCSVMYLADGSLI